MKVIIVLVAILGFARSDEAEDIESAKYFIKCIDKALDGGLPSIPIPNHNPLSIRDISYNDDNELYAIDFTVSNTILWNLLDYNFTDIEAIDYHNPERVAFGYDLYWPVLNLTGDYDIDLKLPPIGLSFEAKGTYEIVLHHTDWTGIFNLTKGEEGVKQHLDEFSLASIVKDVDVILTVEGGDGDYEGSELLIKDLVVYLFDNFPPDLAQYLKDERFNDFWIDHPERIEAILQYCNPSI